MKADEIMARTVYGESRNQSFEGKKAVAWVLRNRADHPGWWGKSLAEVCLKPKAFSCWDDGNRITMLTCEPSTDKSYSECLRAVKLVMADLPSNDPTFGANHYHTLAIRPSWADETKVTVVIGHHKFYKL